MMPKPASAIGMRIDPHAKFASRDCPNCGMRVASNQNRCPICQQAFLSPRLTSLGRLRLPAAIMLLCVMAWVIAQALLP
jgi:hypothetical protein